MADRRTLVCAKCGVPLREAPVTFKYLDHEFRADMPKCPQCGETYISEELVMGKMHDVETELEDK